MTDYHPISCETYAELEVAIVHGTRLRVGWHELDGSQHLESLLPVDLQTRNHEEYLIAHRPTGREAIEIRLDRIDRFTPL